MAELVTTSNLLPTIVDDIRGRAFEYQQSEGIWKMLVKQVGMGEKGNSFTQPMWDPTGGTAEVLTEGVAITNAATYVNTDVNIVSVESGLMTILTKNDEEDATDNIKDRHATHHGITLANKIEAQGHAAGQTFTTHVDLAGAELTDLHIAMMKAKLNASTIKGAGNFKCVNSSGTYLSIMSSLTANPSFGLKGRVGQEAQDKYFVGTLFGDVDLYITDEPYDPEGALHAGAFFKEDAIGMFVPRAFDMVYEEDARLRGTRLVSTQRYGFKVMADKLGLRFTAGNGLLVPVADRGVAKIAIQSSATAPVYTQEVAELS